MKFTAAVAALSFVAPVAAFAPAAFGAPSRTTQLHASVEAATYTFPKSEEIFAEAQTVRRRRCCVQPAPN